MSGQVQELIDKIKSEGVATAEQQAQEIKNKAEVEAKQIKKQAREEADRMIQSAKQETEKMQESAEMALKQGSRDTLLSLKKEIQNYLRNIMTQEVKDALTADQIGNILTQVVGDVASDKNQSMEVILSEENVKKLKDGALAKLQDKLKNGLTVKSSDQMTKGFALSFDGGKSSFEFTDESLAEYISTFLNNQLASIIKG